MSESEQARRGALLLEAARARLEAELRPDRPNLWAPPDEGWLYEHRATFVTLTQVDELRGCVGSIEAVRPLLEDVRHNAIAAAFRDPRFSPLTAAELDGVEVEVTVLSPLEPMEFDGEDDARARLRPGVDGVVLRWGAHRATFLPQVWESLPTPEAFLSSLKRKAGLAPDFWDSGVELECYTARHWSESELV